jgi:predicted RNA-binding protein with PUA-like domain
MHNSTHDVDSTIENTSARLEFNTREDLLNTPAWIVQYKPASVALLREEWDFITDEELDEEGLSEVPDVSRHLDEIRRGDFILFWIAGPGNSAGLYAYGNATGEVIQGRYPKRWSDPDGEQVTKSGMEVLVSNVLEEPFVTRTTLKALPEFADFELFRMPNRPNAFAVTPEQWSIILDHLTKTD